MTTPPRTLTLDLAYAIGDTVHLRCRREPLEGVVTGHIVRPGHVKRIVAWGDGTETDHFDFELSEEPEL